MSSGALGRSPSVVVETRAGVVLLAHSMRPLTERDWGAFLDELWKAARRQGKVRALVSTAGAHPNGSQRIKLGELAKSYPMRIAVCTESREARAVIMAIEWASGIEIRPFPSIAEREACEYLEIAGEERKEVLEAFRRMRLEMT